MEQTAVEVHVLPSQPECLSLPESEGQRDDPAGLEPILRRVLEQLPRLGNRVWGDLLGGHRRGVDQRGGVGGDEAQRTATVNARRRTAWMRRTLEGAIVLDISR